LGEFRQIRRSAVIGLDQDFSVIEIERVDVARVIGRAEESFNISAGHPVSQLLQQSPHLALPDHRIDQFGIPSRGLVIGGSDSRSLGRISTTATARKESGTADKYQASERPERFESNNLVRKRLHGGEAQADRVLRNCFARACSPAEGLVWQSKATEKSISIAIGLSC
jgi:hypothetical protein